MLSKLVAVGTRSFVSQASMHWYTYPSGSWSLSHSQTTRKERDPRTRLPVGLPNCPSSALVAWDHMLSVSLTTSLLRMAIKSRGQVNFLGSCYHARSPKCVYMYTTRGSSGPVADAFIGLVSRARHWEGGAYFDYAVNNIIMALLLCSAEVCLGGQYRLLVLVCICACSRDR